MANLVFTVLLIVFVYPLYAIETLTLDLRGTVTYALQRVPALASVQKQKEITKLALQTSRFLFFPTLGLSLSSGINTTAPNWPTLWSNSLSLVLKQPIFSHSINGIGYKIADTKDAIAKLDLEIERDRLCMKVIKDYYAYSAAVEQRVIKKENAVALIKQLDIVSRRFQQGLKTKRDVLRFEAQVQQATIQEATAKNRVSQTKDVLITTITGSNRQELTNNFEFMPIKPKVSALEPPKEEPKIVDHALFKKLALEQKIASLDVDQAKRQLWPELFATLGATGYAHRGLKNAALSDSSAIFSVGFSLDFELFDFGKRRRDVAIALKNKEIKANSIQTQLSDETATIAKMMTNFSFLKESLSLNKKLLVLEEDNFKRIQTDYLEGKAQYLDIVSALTNLSSVKSALYSSIFDFETEMITYRYYNGTLYDWIF